MIVLIRLSSENPQPIGCGVFLQSVKEGSNGTAMVNTDMFVSYRISVYL